MYYSKWRFYEKGQNFINGQRQAVRLPKEFRFDDEEVSVQKIAEDVLLLPISKSMFVFRNSLKIFSDDFMSKRDQPQMQK